MGDPTCHVTEIMSVRIMSGHTVNGLLHEIEDSSLFFFSTVSGNTFRLSSFPVDGDRVRRIISPFPVDMPRVAKILSIHLPIYLPKTVHTSN